MTELTDEQVDEALETPAINAGVAIMDSIDPELYRRLGELFGEPPTPQD